MSGEVRLCRECRYSTNMYRSNASVECQHPTIIRNDSAVLASPVASGCFARRERARWFGACGRLGKLWEPRTEAPAEPARPVAPPVAPTGKK